MKIYHQQRKGGTSRAIQAQRQSSNIAIDNRTSMLKQANLVHVIQENMSHGNKSFSGIINQRIPIQGWFGIKDNPFFLRRLNKGELSMVKEFVSPHVMRAFEDAQSSETEYDIDKWLKENMGCGFKDIEIANQKKLFPQIESIPSDWITDTHAHNPGGPSIIVQPPVMDSPDDSQMEEERIPADQITPDHLQVDLREDKFIYHRTEQKYDLTKEVKSDVRAAAMLDNSYLATLSTLPIGRSTKPISEDKTDILKEERKRGPLAYKGKTLLHHPDTFWTGTSESKMGFHPANKHANTLEGDYQDLIHRVGHPFKGFVLHEEKGFTMPTVETSVAHTERTKFAEELIERVEEIEGDGFEEMLEILDEVKSELCVTEEARKATDMLRDIIESAIGNQKEGEKREDILRIIGIRCDEWVKITEESSAAKVLRTIVDTYEEEEEYEKESM